MHVTIKIKPLSVWRKHESHRLNNLAQTLPLDILPLLVIKSKVIRD